MRHHVPHSLHVIPTNTRWHRYINCCNVNVKRSVIFRCYGNRKNAMETIYRNKYVNVLINPYRSPSNWKIYLYVFLKIILVCVNWRLPMNNKYNKQWKLMQFIIFKKYFWNIGVWAAISPLQLSGDRHPLSPMSPPLTSSTSLHSYTAVSFY